MALLAVGRNEPVGDALEAPKHDFWKAIRPFDFLLFALFVFDRTAIGPLPLGVVVTAAVIGIGFTRPPIYRVPRLGIYAMIFVGIIAWLAIVSEVNDVDYYQRLLRIALILGMTLILMEGRFHWFSAIAGLVASLLVFNIPMFYLGLTPNMYPPFLTGFLGDKNVSGLWYGVLTVLGLWVFRRARTQVVWLAVSAGVLFLTGSRTAMSAAAVGVLWFFFRNKISWFFRVALAIGLVAALDYAENELARVGTFADRQGSDWFRERIAIAAAEKVDASPWYGQGLTTAWVDLGGTNRVFFFHDSYLALRVEGGWPLFLIVVGLFVLSGVGIMDLKEHNKAALRLRVGEAATIAILVAAWKLGEVFFTSIGGIVLAFALWARFALPAKEINPMAFADQDRNPLPIDEEDVLADAHRKALADPMMRKRNRWL